MQVEPNVFRYADGVNVYLLRREREAILVDFGSGDILDRLADYGVDRVTDVLVTHHHRDAVQGLARARAAGIRIWVPPTERDLIAGIDEHWQSRPLDNYYDLREDRFSLLSSVEVDGVVAEYRTRRYGKLDVLTVPTPGHTAGSVSYVVEIDGRRLAFIGGLLAAPGKVPSLAASQWTYTGIEGLGSMILSGLDLIDREPDRMFPSHGAPIDEPRPAIELTNDRLQRLIDMRSPEWQLASLRERPYLEISRHLLRNRTSVSNSYVVLSETGGALVIDYGYEGPTFGDTLQAVKRHAYADPLAEPGAADLTVHVDFARLADAAKAGGAARHGPVPQGGFLRALGIEARAARLKARATPSQAAGIDAAIERLTGPGADGMGELFKAMCVAHPDLQGIPGFAPAQIPAEAFS